MESSRSLAVTIVKDRRDELRELCLQFEAKTVITLRALRSFTGKCQSMATILHTWRPFVHQLYGAIYSPLAPS